MRFALSTNALGAVAPYLMSCKWFDWWGGWCFGYRPIVDVAILLAFLSFPVIEEISPRRSLRVVAGALFAYSLAVQVLGAWVYDVAGWNGRTVWDVKVPGTGGTVTFDEQIAASRYMREQGGEAKARILNIDDVANRERLWSATDSPIIYYLANFSRAYKSRKTTTAQFLVDDG